MTDAKKLRVQLMRELSYPPEDVHMFWTVYLGASAARALRSMREVQVATDVREIRGVVMSLGA